MDKEKEVRKVLAYLESELMGEGFLIQLKEIVEDNIVLVLNRISHCCPVNVTQMINYIRKIIQMELNWIKNIEVIV